MVMGDRIKKASKGSKKKQATKFMLSIDFLNDSVQIRIAFSVSNSEQSLKVFSFF